MGVKTYSEAVAYLYATLPMFQRVGASAYKKDLHNTVRLCEAIGNPHLRFRSVHVAGTNGKGSTSHMLAAVLQASGYKTGLYTSPHLKSFTERIRINGQPVHEEFVIGFVNRIQPVLAEINPSFFELTVAMAFDYFAQAGVDVAIVEVGLGGRLDSTNIITPLVSVITNISYDHMDLLGNTLPEIAAEKAGIIKRSVPCVISQAQAEVAAVFRDKASREGSSITFAADVFTVSRTPDGHWSVRQRISGQETEYALDLPGLYQQWNLAGVLVTLDILRSSGYVLESATVRCGLMQAAAITGLKGRWQQLADRPIIIADTGHNEAGLLIVVEQIRQQQFERLWIVFGMVKDKDPLRVLQILPKEAYYFFCQAHIPRAMPAGELAQRAAAIGLMGEVVQDVNAALRVAKEKASARDMIFVGGSTFVVAEIENL